MNRTSEVGGAQRAEAGEFAGADGVALEAGLLVAQRLPEGAGLPPGVDQGESASQAGDGAASTGESAWKKQVARPLPVVASQAAMLRASGKKYQKQRGASGSAASSSFGSAGV